MRQRGAMPSAQGCWHCQSAELWHVLWDVGIPPGTCGHCNWCSLPNWIQLQLSLPAWQTQGTAVVWGLMESTRASLAGQEEPLRGCPAAWPIAQTWLCHLCPSTPPPLCHVFTQEYSQAALMHYHLGYFHHGPHPHCTGRWSRGAARSFYQITCTCSVDRLCYCWNPGVLTQLYASIIKNK